MTAPADEPSANLGARSGEIQDHKEGDGRDEEERPLDGAVEREGASVRVRRFYPNHEYHHPFSEGDSFVRGRKTMRGIQNRFWGVQQF